MLPRKRECSAWKARNTWSTTVTSSNIGLRCRSSAPLQWALAHRLIRRCRREGCRPLKPAGGAHAQGPGCLLIGGDLSYLHRAVVVAVFATGAVQVFTHQIVNVVSMWHGFVTAFAAVVCELS